MAENLWKTPAIVGAVLALVILSGCTGVGESQDEPLKQVDTLKCGETLTVAKPDPNSSIWYDKEVFDVVYENDSVWRFTVLKKPFEERHVHGIGAKAMDIEGTGTDFDVFGRFGEITVSCPDIGVPG